MYFQLNKRALAQARTQSNQRSFEALLFLLLFSLFLVIQVYHVGAQTKSEPASKEKPLLEQRILTNLASGTVRQFKFTQPLKSPKGITFLDEAGKRRSLKEWRGKTVLLNFWAPWCDACREELPSMQKLRQRLDNQDFEIIALNIEPDAKKGRAYLDQLGIKNIISVLDKEKAALTKLSAVGIPTSILFDCKGRELGRLRGSAVWNADAAILLIKSLMRASGCYDEERDKV